MANISENILINDRLSLKDDVRPNGLWAKTEIIGGYGDIITDEFGLTSLSEVTFRQHNIVPIGGVSYVMQNLFGVTENQIEIPTLYSEAGIGAPDSAAPTETYQTPDGTRTVIYRYGHLVQLFGIGITGTGENDVTIYSPDYREKSINLTKTNKDGQTVTGTMLPFRYTTGELSTAEKKQYFGKKKSSDGYTGYYLKKFETDPVIKHIWKTTADTDNETLVSSSDVWSNASGLNAVESLTEMYLKLTKKDVKEWFDSIEEPTRTRFNTLALYNGQYVKDTAVSSDTGDYRDVRLFSKFCINPEYLNLSKDLNIIYRVYGA